MPLSGKAVDVANECVQHVTCVPGPWKFVEGQGLYCLKPNHLKAELVCRGAK